jgi:hypothetical protein
MNETDAALTKLQSIQKLWLQLGRMTRESPEYEKLMAQIRVLSAEYQSLVDGSTNPYKAR